MKRGLFVCIGVVFFAFNSIGFAFASISPAGDILWRAPFSYGPPPVLNIPLAEPTLHKKKKVTECPTNIEITTLAKKYKHAIRRYLHIKTKSILMKNAVRVRKGMTMSQYFPDYREYRFFIRTQLLREVRLEKPVVRKDYYLWKEDDKIIMAADVMLMSNEVKNRFLDKAVSKGRRRWAADEYRRVAEKTMRVSASTPFRLDCQHSAELDRLLKKATRDLVAQDDDMVISPRTFDKLLTILRAYITFSYYKDLSHDDFGQRFKKLGEKIGRGIWSHQKLTRLLGLHVMGRIETNRAFREKYAKAITYAAKRTPSIPRKWIEEIIWIETKGDPMTISRAGAYGLMQLMPLVYIGMGSKKSRSIPLSFANTINPFNAETNIVRGAEFLHKLRQMLKPHMRRYAKSTQKKIIFHAYNCGVTRVISLLKKHGLGYKRYLPGETKAYLDRLVDFPGR